MPGISTRSTNISSTHTRATPEPVGIKMPNMPTPIAYYLTRGSFLLSSLPTIGTSEDASLRQFYGGRNLPMRRLVR